MEGLSQLNKLKARIRYNPDKFEDETVYEQILLDLLDDAKNIALSNIYPFENWDKYDLPKKYYNWQIRACIELFNLAGRANISTYSENGLSWSFFSDGLSKSLMAELIPHVGTPKIQDEEEE